MGLCHTAPSWTQPLGLCWIALFKNYSPWASITSHFSKKQPLGQYYITFLEETALGPIMMLILEKTALGPYRYLIFTISALGPYRYHFKLKQKIRTFGHYIFKQKPLGQLYILILVKNHYIQPRIGFVLQFYYVTLYRKPSGLRPLEEAVWRERDTCTRGSWSKLKPFKGGYSKSRRVVNISIINSLANIYYTLKLNICVHEDPMRRIYKTINKIYYLWWTTWYTTASVWNTSKLLLF